MKKHHDLKKKTLRLDTTTIRDLQAAELEQAGGALTGLFSCVRACLFTFNPGDSCNSCDC